MIKKYVNLSESNIGFKNLISGPAPVGRILNYLILTGKGLLHHKSGNRDTHLYNNIGDAWCTEFMIGLGLVMHDDIGEGESKKLYLTSQGRKVYEAIKKYPNLFDENNNDSVYKELNKINPNAYNIFFEAIKKSPVYLNLCAFISNNDRNVFNKLTFADDYYQFFLNLYDDGTPEYNRQARTSTAGNRMPSTIQLCKFFKLVKIDSANIKFDYKKMTGEDRSFSNSSDINTTHAFIDVDDDRIKKLNKEYKKIETEVNKLIEKYGVSGNAAYEIVGRNSSVQHIFRNNLLAKYGCECAICKKNIEEVLVASHIIPAAKCDVAGKADCENGLMLCTLHDKLFDRYLITFDWQTGQLLYADCLADKLEEYQLPLNFKLGSSLLTPERKEYLKNHNEEFRKRNS